MGEGGGGGALGLNADTDPAIKLFYNSGSYASYGFPPLPCLDMYRSCE